MLMEDVFTHASIEQASSHRAIIEVASRQSIEPASSLHRACIEPASSLHRATASSQHRAFSIEHRGRGSDLLWVFPIPLPHFVHRAGHTQGLAHDKRETVFSRSASGCCPVKHTAFGKSAVRSARVEGVSRVVQDRGALRALAARCLAVVAPIR